MVRRKQKWLGDLICQLESTHFPVQEKTKVVRRKQKWLGENNVGKNQQSIMLRLLGVLLNLPWLSNLDLRVVLLDSFGVSQDNS